MKKVFVFFVLALVFSGFNTFPVNEKFSLTKYVNPFVGTGGHGHTFPGATVPFGMVQLSPDTRLTGWDGCSGYHYDDSVIYGFSHTHLSGTGVPDYCDILFMPYAENINSDISYNTLNSGSFTSVFSHSEETASPGYYSVMLKRGSIKAELTTSTRVGFHKYTFPEEKTSKIFVDLKHRDEVLESYIKIKSSTEISGYRRSTGWARDQRVYFHAVFSKPFSSYGLYSDNNRTEETQMLNGKNIKALFDFGDKAGVVFVKVGISAVSDENAKINLNAEINDWDFDRVRQTADIKWNDYLNKIQVKSGDTKKMKIFYTALYHTAICPNTYNDVDGSYLGRDLKVHKADHDYYTVFSLWDTYRANHPLLNIIERTRTVDFIKTFLLQYEQGGRLPVWELSANETDCMIGYHSIPVITDAYVNGIRGFNERLALDAMVHSGSLNIYGLDSYRKYGYIPADKEHESVSKTLEYSYDDWCISTYLLKLSHLEGKNASAGKDSSLYAEYKTRSSYYMNLFDKTTGFMRPKLNGAWKAPFLPTDVDNNYTEANAWQYTFYIPQNPYIFDEYYKEGFEKKLDELLTADSRTTGREQSDITGLIGQYAHGNEPSHQIAYMYNYTKTPWKAADITYKIMTEFYKDSPDGLIGNEDCGQMSAWYVFSAMGFYPLCPGTGMYFIGTPLFDEVKINLENGKTFTIKANNLSEKNKYVSTKESGLEDPVIHFDKIYKGGVLNLEMTSDSLLHKGYIEKGASNEYQIRKKYETIYNVLPSPVTGVPVLTFRDSLKISFSDIKDSDIRYTTDGSEPDEYSAVYTEPFYIYNTVKIKSIAVSGSRKSFITESEYYKIPSDMSVEIISIPNPQYTAGGPDALIDGIRGPLNWRLGKWQGYQSQDFSAVITLTKEKLISKIGAGFLQDAWSWIWMPVYVEFEVSTDGKNFTKVARIENTVSEKDLKTQIVDFVQTIDPVKAKYIKVFAKNFGKIPSWHEGAGEDAFIFVDEIIIE